ncbi:MAG: DUF3179 domain-containing protein [Chloroflexi bacterium]|nr:MAG: DUF3179 domain-containing protein [Chloroflexota bacterium]
MKMHKLWLGLAIFLAACSAETAVPTPTSISSTNIEPTSTTEPTEIPSTNTAPPPTVTAEPTEAAIEEETAVPTIAPTPTDTPPTRTPDPVLVEKYAEYELITLLPPDGIPAIDNPEFITVAEADGIYQPGELIIGVEFNGDARAYSVPLLSNHEIVNDVVGGEKIAVTW